LGPSRVSVIIPAKDEEGLIGEIVDAVKTYANEVLVVDGHSMDRTREIAESPMGRTSPETFLPWWGRSAPARPTW
jgi:dolichol-phosphate mannosyltransferase